MKYNQQENDNRPIDTELKNNSEGRDPEASKNLKIEKQNKTELQLLLINNQIVIW